MTHPPRHNKDARGFTLLELMISLTILAFGILAVAGLFTYSIGGNAQGKHLTEATDFAQSKLDELASVVVFEDLVNGSEQHNSGNVTYTVAWTVDEPIPAIGSRLKRITVTASWVIKGHPHSVEFATMRSKN